MDIFRDILNIILNVHNGAFLQKYFTIFSQKFTTSELQKKYFLFHFSQPFFDIGPHEVREYLKILLMQIPEVFSMSQI